MDPFPPDPYAALKVSRDASSAEIKTAYRKLALKCHPDKAPDKADEFHRIQQAYELIGEDASRQKYEDSLRVSQLKQNIYQRRRSGPGPNVDIRTAAFDVRPNSYQGASFQARGPPRYEERRPPPSAAGGPPSSYPTPRSPYGEDENADHYFAQRASSRKYEGFDGKRAPSTRTPKSAPRSEETRETLRKQDKTESAKSRNDKKKQRDQEMGRERRGKFASASLDSDDSEDDREPPTRRRSSRQEDFGRRNSARSDDDLREELPRQKYHSQSNNVKEYINRAKVEAVSGERGSPPPPPPSSSYPRRGSAQDLPIHSRSSDEQDSSQEYRRTNRGPAKLPKSSSSRPKERTPEPVTERKPATSKDNRAKNGHATSERRPPGLYNSSSAPANIKIPKARSSDEYDARGAPPPRLDRSSTVPANQSQQPPASSRAAPRKTDTAPTVSSNLRHTETQDSGYSTGTSPNDTNQTQFPSSTKYQYGADTVQVDAEYESVLREPNRPMRRSPSPIRDAPPQPRERPSSGRDRERGRGAPPPSRSASYQTPQVVPEQEAPRRRPSLSRNNSGRESSGRVPTVPNLQRGASMPIPPPQLRTGTQAGPEQAREQLFGEITSSPVEFRDPFGSVPSPTNGAARRGFDSSKVNYAPRISTDDISYAYRAPPTQQNGGSGGARAERRGSEDMSKQSQYRSYMNEAGGRERRATRPGVAVG